MEEATIRYANTLNKENRERFIEYLKMWNSKDLDEHIERRNKMGIKNSDAVRLSFQTFLMSFFDTSGALKKLESETQTQSHST